jgi:hypothetical protein
MEQIGQAVVEDGAGSACSTVPGSAAGKGGMPAAVDSTGVEPLSLSACGESVLDEDADGVGEAWCGGIS